MKDEEKGHFPTTGSVEAAAAGGAARKIRGSRRPAISYGSDKVQVAVNRGFFA